MTLAVVDRVEARRPATAGAPLPAVAGLVGLVGNGAADPASAQVGAVLAGGVRLVRADSIGADRTVTGLVADPEKLLTVLALDIQAVRDIAAAFTLDHPPGLDFDASCGQVSAVWSAAGIVQ